MKRAALALLFAALPAAATASPPAEGTSYTFYDPIFEATVFCDHLSELQAIVSADNPDEVYRGYFETMNALNEPTCAAVVPTGYVLDVSSLGVMERDGLTFYAWAVKAQVGEITGYALYLEHFEQVIA
jgi:hypothetical protein